MRRCSAGMTLAETLVALSLGSVCLTVITALLLSSAGSANALARASTATQTERLAAALLREEIELAGSGREEAGLVIEPFDAREGGDRLTVHYTTDAYRVAETERDAAFFVARDSARRWNLYRQPIGGRKQPWLLGVTGLRVAEGRDEQGNRIPRAELLSAARTVTALQIELAFETGETASIWVDVRRGMILRGARGPSEPASVGTTPSP